MPVNGFESIGQEILDHCKCVFGETVTYLPKAGGSYPITGIYDNQFEQVDPDTEVVVASNQPTLGVKLSDLLALPAKGDQLVIRSIKYRVIDSQDDGVAGAVLILHKVGCA